MEWKAWWKKNAGKHPVMDAELEGRVVDRVSAIEAKLRKGGPYKMEAGRIRVTHGDAVTLVDGGLSREELGPAVMGEEKVRGARGWDRSLVRILARFGTAPAGGYRNAAARSGKQALREVFREELPGDGYCGDGRGGGGG
ncbi:MAG: hypothetical protein ACTHN5_13170 [Phycisphaerae bacterium]